MRAVLSAFWNLHAEVSGPKPALPHDLIAVLLLPGAERIARQTLALRSTWFGSDGLVVVIRRDETLL